MSDFKVEGGGLRRIAKDLRKHGDGKRLAKELRTELRKVAKPFVPAVRKAIAALPSQGENARRGRTPLRKRMQKAARLEVKTAGKFAGVTVRVDHKKMPPGQGNLPAYMEGEPRYTRWRSPNWGRDDWKTQPSHPYFYAAVRPAEEQARRAAADVIGRISKELGK